MSLQSTTKKLYESPEVTVLLIGTESGLMSASPTESFEDDGTVNNW